MKARDERLPGEWDRFRGGYDREQAAYDIALDGAFPSGGHGFAPPSTGMRSVLRSCEKSVQLPIITTISTSTAGSVKTRSQSAQTASEIAPRSRVSSTAASTARSASA